MTALDLFAVLAEQGFEGHDVVIDRFTGRGAYESDDEYDLAAGSTLGFVSDGIKIMVNAAGEQIASTARVALPKGTPYVPIRSRVTLPPEFGNRVCRVVAVAVADGGGQPTPDYIELGLI